MNSNLLPFLTAGAKNTGMLDSVAGQAVNTVESLDLQATNGPALNAEIQSLRKTALVIALSLVDAVIEKDIAEDELPSDRLDMLMAGASADADDDEFEVDQNTLDIIAANVQDAFASLGVSDELIKTMFSKDPEADEAIEAVAELVESVVPTGDDLDEFIDLFVYGEPQEETGEMLDGVSLGKTTTKSGKFGNIVYKAVKAIRNGKVAVVNKRVSGRVKLSAKQKSALKKARIKAHAGPAINKRIRSMKKAQKL